MSTELNSPQSPEIRPLKIDSPTSSQTEDPKLDGCLREGEDIVISVRDLWKIFRLGTTAVQALRGVSFDVKRGEFLAIVGTSGSGKSTLLNMLAGLEQPSRGKVFIHGRDLTRMSEHDLVNFRKNHIGFIFQSFNLIASQNAQENVELPLIFRGEKRTIRRRKAKRMLYQVGLGRKCRHRPSEMSGGEQQRVGVARALVVDPEIVFADEPTGNLDSRTTDEILHLRQAKLVFPLCGRPWKGSDQDRADLVKDLSAESGCMIQNYFNQTREGIEVSRIDLADLSQSIEQALLEFDSDQQDQAVEEDLPENSKLVCYLLPKK